MLQSPANCEVQGFLPLVRTVEQKLLCKLSDLQPILQSRPIRGNAVLYKYYLNCTVVWFGSIPIPPLVERTVKPYLQRREKKDYERYKGGSHCVLSQMTGRGLGAM